MASKAPFVSSIRCIGFNFPKAVMRTVQSRIDRWISTHAQVDAGLDPEYQPHYRLILQREGDTPLCVANMELRIGQSTLRASSYAHDIQAAVSRCLNELMGHLKGPFSPPSTTLVAMPALSTGPKESWLISGTLTQAH